MSFYILLRSSVRQFRIAHTRGPNCSLCRNGKSYRRLHIEVHVAPRGSWHDYAAFGLSISICSSGPAKNSVAAPKQSGAAPVTFPPCGNFPVEIPVVAGLPKRNGWKRRVVLSNFSLEDQYPRHRSHRRTPPRKSAVQASGLASRPRLKTR